MYVEKEAILVGDIKKKIAHDGRICFGNSYGLGVLWWVIKKENGRKMCFYVAITCKITYQCIVCCIRKHFHERKIMKFLTYKN